MKLSKKIAKELFLVTIFSLISCNKSYYLNTVVLEKDNDAFGNIRFVENTKTFQSMGFDFGDMITMQIKDFSSECKDLVKDIAMVTNYNEVGYFVPCLCDYENSKNKVDYSFAIDTIDRSVKDVVGKEVIFTMKQKGGYNETRNLVKADRKLTYDEADHNNLMFANFRDVASTTGQLLKIMRPNCLFRGSSPFNYRSNPERNRFVDSLMRSYKIDYEISLSTTYSKICDYMASNESSEFTYSKDLFDSSTRFCQVAAASDYFTMDTPPLGDEVRDGQCMAKVFNFMINKIKADSASSHIPSFYIHCDEGKDRTSFVCMIIEALAGASLDDIIDDFMLTFKNYYNISSANDAARYDKIAELNIYHFLYALLLAREGLEGAEIAQELSSTDWYNFNSKEAVINLIGEDHEALKTSAKAYLMNTLNISESDVATLANWIDPNSLK